MASDPTRTKGIRNRWTNQFKRRYRTLAGRVSQLINATNGPLDPLFVEFFNRWTEGQVNELLFEFVTTPPPHWQNQFVDQAFSRGLVVSQREIRRDDPEFTARNTGTAITLLYARSFEDLKGVTNEMQAQMSRELVKGIQLEDSKTAIVKSVNDRVAKIGFTRSKILAQTQTVSTYNTAVIDNVRQFTLQTGDEGKLLWITQEDERVRTTHALRNQKLFTPRAAFNLINEPNCRCQLKAIVGAEIAAEETPEARRTRTRIRKTGLARSEQATEERRFRATLDRARRAEGLPDVG